MDPQIASQFLGSLFQVGGTIFAVYIAVIIYVVQDEMLQKLFFEKWYIWMSFALGCILWVTFILDCSLAFLGLDLQTQFSQSSAIRLVIMFFFALSVSLLQFSFILLERRDLLE